MPQYHKYDKDGSLMIFDRDGKQITTDGFICRCGCGLDYACEFTLCEATDENAPISEFCWEEHLKHCDACKEVHGDE